MLGVEVDRLRKESSWCCLPGHAGRECGWWLGDDFWCGTYYSHMC